MLKLPEQIQAIKKYHSYNGVQQTSEWGAGLSKDNKMRNGCPLDKLRNEVKDENWEWLFTNIFAGLDHYMIPERKEEEFRKRFDELNTFVNIHLHPNQSFSDYIISAYSNRYRSEFKRTLWAVLVSSMEILEYIPYEDAEYTDDSVDDHPLFTFK